MPTECMTAVAYRRVARSSALETALLSRITAARLPRPEREVVFAPPRRWRFDFAWPAYMLAVEVEGAIWTQGRHTRGAGYLADLEKYNEAALLGWTVLRVTREHITSGQTIEWIRAALGSRKP